MTGDQVSAWGDSLQILDEGGVTAETYLWDGTQWLDLNTFAAAEKVIAPGEGILIATINAAVGVQFAGEVGSDDIQLVSVAGFNFVGNSTPVDMNIQNITISGTQVSAWGDSLQLLDEGGATVETYIWDGTQWLDLNTFAAAERVIAPGMGVLIATINADVEINIPAPEL